MRLGRADDRGRRQIAVLEGRGETPHKWMAKIASTP